jgi:hypothetical protein
MRDIAKIIAVSLIGLPACSEAAIACVPVDRVVTLAGRVTVERHFGPPNFGETPKIDAHLSVPMLHLRRPISICGASKSRNAAGRKTTKIQLVSRMRRFSNAHVFNGTLSYADNASHFTKIVMDVRTAR